MSLSPCGDLEALLLPGLCAIGMLVHVFCYFQIILSYMCWFQGSLLCSCWEFVIQEYLCAKLWKYEWIIFCVLRGHGLNIWMIMRSSSTTEGWHGCFCGLIQVMDCCTCVDTWWHWIHWEAGWQVAQSTCFTGTDIGYKSLWIYYLHPKVISVCGWVSS